MYTHKLAMHSKELPELASKSVLQSYRANQSQHKQSTSFNMIFFVLSNKIEIIIIKWILSKELKKYSHLAIFLKIQ